MNNPPDNTPQTYWEKRCNINEEVLFALIDIVGQMAPAHMVGDGFYNPGAFKPLIDQWNEAIEKLDAEHE